MEARPLINERESEELERQIARTVERETPRLRRFLRPRLPGWLDVEDVLQDVFVELVEAYRLAQPIERAGAWLLKVARNRTIDLLRRKRAVGLADFENESEGPQASRLEDLLPSPDAGPDAAYARRVLVEELARALEELPRPQREVFLAHEVEGESFRDMSARTGIKVNTLLARKRYAVVHLRARLADIHEAIEKGGTP